MKLECSVEELELLFKNFNLKENTKNITFIDKLLKEASENKSNTSKN